MGKSYDVTPANKRRLFLSGNLELGPDKAFVNNRIVKIRTMPIGAPAARTLFNPSTGCFLKETKQNQKLLLQEALQSDIIYKTAQPTDRDTHQTLYEMRQNGNVFESSKYHRAAKLLQKQQVAALIQLAMIFRFVRPRLVSSSWQEYFKSMISSCLLSFFSFLKVGHLRKSQTL